MIMNPGKFQTLFLDKRKGNQTKQTKNIDQKEIKVISKVKHYK